MGSPILEAWQVVSRETQDRLYWYPRTAHLCRYFPDSWSKMNRKCLLQTYTA